MSLQDKIKMILEGQKDDTMKAVIKAAKDNDEDDGKDSDEPDADDKGGASDNDADDQNQDDEDTDVSKDSTKKDDVSVKEALVVPGSPDMLGVQQSQDLKSKPAELSGSEKTNKLTSKYNKGTKQPKLDAVSQSGSGDEKASAETTKIKSAYSSSTMPKLKAEAFEALFSGETLTEEFKFKAEAIFEAAVEQVAEAKVAALQEEYQEQLTEAIDEVKGELVEQIDGYLDLVIEKWMEDNAVALESGIKVEMVSSFMEKMKDVFTEHYIDVPESKLDIVAEQAAQLEEAQEDLEVQKELTEQALAEVNILKCDAIIAEASEGLSAIESEKLYSLAENVEFDTTEEFAGKVKALKESYFRKGAAKITTQDTTITASTTVNEVHADVAAVMKVLKASAGQDGQLKIIRSSN